MYGFNATMPDILWRQGEREKREPTPGAGSTGSPSTAARINPPATQSQAGKEVFVSLGTTT